LFTTEWVVYEKQNFFLRQSFGADLFSILISTKIEDLKNIGKFTHHRNLDLKVFHM